MKLKLLVFLNDDAKLRLFADAGVAACCMEWVSGRMAFGCALHGVVEMLHGAEKGAEKVHEYGKE